MTIQKFTFNPLMENTYVLSDASRTCVIIDPGCYYPDEQKALREYIDREQLRPVRLWLTHAHFDHIFGLRYVLDTWGLAPELHRPELPVLQLGANVARMYGFALPQPPEPKGFFDMNAPLTFGETTLELRFTPGHSPGSVCFYHPAGKQIIVGDVLFEGSIGRTDLPGGDLATLETSIRTQLYTLPDDVRVYAGHGAETTIGHEKRHNPFVRGKGL